MPSEGSSGGTACERCPSTGAVPTGFAGDVLGYDYLCRTCLHELVPDQWGGVGA